MIFGVWSWQDIGHWTFEYLWHRYDHNTTNGHKVIIWTYIQVWKHSRFNDIHLHTILKQEIYISEFASTVFFTPEIDCWLFSHDSRNPKDNTVGCIHEFGPVCLWLSRWFQWHACLSELLSRWNIISLYITIRMNAWSRSLWNMDGRLSRYSSGYRNVLNDTLSFNCLAHNCFCWNKWN